MTITNIISAIGNNNSIYPLLVRDCGIEAPSKIYLTYKQNKSDKFIAKNAVRERTIDEFGTSAIWLGGIPTVEFIANKFIKKKGFNPNVNLKLFKENEYQGINKNIEKFKNIAPDAVKDLIIVKENKALYEKLLSSKFVAAIGIPVVLMGYLLPKLNFAISNKIMKKKSSSKIMSEKTPRFSTSNPAFKGNLASSIANMTTVQKMAATDGGLTIGRVGTSRNKNEALDNGFKMGGMLYLNFVAPKQIAKILDKTMNKIFNINVNLDPLMLNDKEFISQIKENKLQLPKSNNEKDIINFIDNNPKSLFVKFASKFNKLKMLNETTRDPRAYVNIKKLAEFKKNIEAFSQKALYSKEITKFTQKAKFVKSLNIIANVAISSTLLAYCLPKAQFAFRKFVTGSELEPGLIKKADFPVFSN